MVSELGDANPNAPDLVNAIASLSMALETPCGGRTVAVAIAKLCNTLQIASPAQDVLEAYCGILGSYPYELVEHATIQLIRNHRYPSFPKPADWLQYIEPIYNERKAELYRITRAQDKLRFAKKISGGRP
jgi:hypothetical protein